MQHVSFFQSGALQVAQVSAIEENERIVLYLTVEVNSFSLKLLSQFTAELRFEPGQGFVQAADLQSDAICAQMMTPETVKAYCD